MGDVARRHAFAFVLTGNTTYCDIAGDIVSGIISGAFGPVWANASCKGLTLYTVASRVAPVYDWCASSWNASFNRIVSEALAAHAAVIVDNGGSQQNTDAASNWQGARGSSALLCLLASDSPAPNASVQLAWAFNHTSAYLLANYGPSASRSAGWNIESVGYNLYPSAK